MKKLLIIFIFATSFFTSCETNSFISDDTEKNIIEKVLIDKSALIKTRKIKFSPQELLKVNSFIDKRVEKISEKVGIINKGEIFLKSINSISSECEESYSIRTNGEMQNYEIISITSEGGRIEGYLWNFYGEKIRSFYQEIKYNDDGTLSEIVLWSEDNRIFFSTDERRVVASISTNAEEENYEQCVARVFQAAKQACDADPVCNLRCALLPGVCEGCMLTAAAVACMING